MPMSDCVDVPATTTLYRHDVFISHSPADSFWVEQWLIPQLSAAGLIVCTERDSFELGVPRLDNLEQVVDQSRHILLVLSPAWVQSEWNAVEALLTQTIDPAARQRRLLPLLLHSCQPPRRIAQLAAADFRQVEQWDDQLRRLIDAVRGVRRLTAVARPASSAATLDSDQALRNRSRMLVKVHNFWVRGVLDSSRNDAALVALGLEFIPEAVAHPWRMLVQQPEQLQRDLPPGTHIIEVFDALHGELLILGEPGSGKTSLLLELTRDLLERATHDTQHPIPVVFTLSVWAEQRKPLDAWLIDELNARYDVPHQVAQAWITNDQILPLLDGLDEVKAEHRCACLDAINVFRREHGLVNLVVCSRIADYTALATQLKLGGAVLIQPLTPEQIDTCLASAGDRLSGLRRALRESPALQEMATSPLLLNIMILTYQGQTVALPPVSSSADEWQTHLFTAYVEGMFARRSIDTRYSRPQTIGWLSRLARSLKQQSQTVFFIEHLQPSWLPTPKARWCYGLLDRLGVGTLCGLGYWLLIRMILVLMGQNLENGDGRRTAIAVALIVGLFGDGSTIVTLKQRVISRLAFNGLLGAIVAILLDIWFFGTDDINTNASRIVDIMLFSSVGTFAGVFIGRPHLKLRNITVIERLRWSWRKALQSAPTNVIVGIITGIVVGFNTQPIAISSDASGVRTQITVASAQANLFNTDQTVTPSDTSGADAQTNGTSSETNCNEICYSLQIGLYISLIFMLLTGMLFGFVSDEVETRTRPNEGIHRSAGGALIVGLNFGFVVGVVQGVGAGLLAGVITALAFGGGAFLSHYALRLVLWRSDVLPLRCARFLDYAAERIFLRKVGGGYIFIHRYLLEYFAALEDQTDDAPYAPRKRA